MFRWMIRIGYCFLVAGAVLVSPLPDLLPIDMWERLKDIGRHRESATFFRVVPGEDHFAFVGASFIVAGLLLVTVAGLMRRRLRG